jgi:hypothetical protein
MVNSHVSFHKSGNYNENQSLFSLRLKYHIVDPLSVSYLPKLVSH